MEGTSLQKTEKGLSKLTKLLLVSLDVLSLITPYMSGHSIAKLWLAGNKRMQEMLMRHGVVKSFRVTILHLQLLIWPQLISKFAYLEDVSIVQQFKDVEARMHGIDVHMLPKTLKSLELDINGVFLALMDGTHNPPKPKHIGHLFPVLERIVMPRLTRSWGGEFDWQFFSGFPQSMRELVTGPGGPANERSFGSIACYIPGLQTLTCSTLPRYPVFHPPQLPPALQSLKVSNCGNYRLLRSLPTSLKHLSIEFSQDANDIEAENWKYLPPLLQTLSLVIPLSYDDALLESIPNTLIELSLTLPALKDDIDLSNWKNLKIFSIKLLSYPKNLYLLQLLQTIPPSLEVLDINSSAAPVFLDEEMIIILRSSNLKRFGESMVVSLKLEGISHLPKQLSNLRWVDSEPFTDGHVENLPKTIRSLQDVGVWRLSVKYGLPALSSLPLEELVTPCNCLDDAEAQVGAYMDEEDPKVIRPKLLQFLPPTLTLLNWKLPPFSLWEFNFTDLNRFYSLKTMRIQIYECFGMEDPFITIVDNILPPNLTDLAIGTLPVSSSVLMHLPRHLINLNVRVDGILSDDHLSNLPPQLITLQVIAPKGSYTAARFSRLPRSLSQVTLPRSPRCVGKFSDGWKIPPVTHFQ
jgi:hypothetical protein